MVCCAEFGYFITRKHTVFVCSHTKFICARNSVVECRLFSAEKDDLTDRGCRQFDSDHAHQSVIKERNNMVKLSIKTLYNEDKQLIATENGLEQLLAYIDEKAKTISLRHNMFYDVEGVK